MILKLTDKELEDLKKALVIAMLALDESKDRTQLANRLETIFKRL